MSLCSPIISFLFVFSVPIIVLIPFAFTTEKKIMDLKKIQLKRTEAKMNCAVNSFMEWRDARLETYTYDYGIHMCDLFDLKSLEKMNLNHSLCRFIPEVTKSKGEGPYPGRTLYQMVVCIQKYLNINKIQWKLLDPHDQAFTDLRTVLDNVMKERASLGIGTTKKQAETITYDYEEKLWSRLVLGEDTPDKLRNTCLYLIGINCCLRASDEHYNLRRDIPGRRSQFIFKRNFVGVRCLVYEEDTVTKTNDGGLVNMKRDRKVVWIYPAANSERDPVRLVDKYLSLCPDFHRKPNFYLHSLSKPSPCQWYGEQVIVFAARALASRNWDKSLKLGSLPLSMILSAVSAHLALTCI